MTVTDYSLKNGEGTVRSVMLREYGGAVVVCLGCVVWVLQLWNADLSVPFDYERADGLHVSLRVKDLSESGWCLHYARLGAPAEVELYDFPLLAVFHFALIKVLSFVITDYAHTLNLYFLMTFPLAVVTALFVLRSFAVSFPVALVVSLLFAFLPYHFWRGERHLSLAAYYLVPLSVMVVLWVWHGEPLFVRQATREPGHWRWGSGKGMLSVGVCLAMGIEGLYYGFFTCIFLLVAGGRALLRQRSLQSVATVGILGAALVGMFLLTLVPSFWYIAHHGKNPQTAQRIPQETDVYGLKIAQLLLPVTNHRFPPFAEVKERYNESMPPVNENDAASLGLIGSGGFLFLLGRLLYRHRDGETARLLDALSSFTLVAVLLATVGGFASLFAVLVSPQLRAHNRISIYIAFFALFAVALVLDYGQRRWVTTPQRRAVWYGLLAGLLLFGLWDQTTPEIVPPYARLQANYSSDADFVQQIEAAVPAQSMIFQLPYVPYPEHIPVHRMIDYDHARGYLHSQTLRWSYAAIKGRDTDMWLRQVSGQPIEQMVATLTTAGFRGIYIDRYGYADSGVAIETQLTQLLGVSPLVSRNQRLSYFSLPTPARNSQAQ